MKILTIAMIIFSNMIIKLSAFAQVNPTGTWKRNEKKTDAGGLSINSVPFLLEISENSNTITIKGTSKNKAGEVSVYTDVLNIDGKLSERTAGDEKKEMFIKWSTDQREFTENGTYKDRQGDVKETHTQSFTITDDGKELKIKDEWTVDGSTYHLEEIFDKQ